MARLSTLDASFLRVETPTAHMHVGWVAALELPPAYERLDAAALSDRIAARLHLAPRFRQRLGTIPLGLGEPAWIDDENFVLSRHIRIVEPERPLTRAEFRELSDRFFSKQLRRDRPLWEILIVPRLGRRRAAVLGKVHHAMVDGIAAVELGMVLFDLAPDAALPDAVDWQPQPAAGPVRAAIDAVADTALEQFRSARRTTAAGLSAGRTLRVADTMRRAAFSLAEDAVRAAPPSYLNVPIEGGRTLSTHSFLLTRFSHVKTAARVKLNDVVLAVATGALRRLALERREELCDLRVMIPVSVRGSDDESAVGNRITFGFIELPIAEARPSVRLATIYERTQDLKDSGRIGGSDMILRSASLLPPALKDKAARFAASPRLYNLTVSNVPGPRLSLYAAGARVSAIYPVIPIPDRHALSIGVLTYDDSVHFCGYAAANVLPRLRLSHVLEEALAELEVGVGGRARLQKARRDRGRGAETEAHRPAAEAVG